MTPPGTPPLPGGNLSPRTPSAPSAVHSGGHPLGVTQLMRRMDMITAVTRLLLENSTFSEAVTLQRCARLLAGDLASWVIVDMERAGVDILSGGGLPLDLFPDAEPQRETLELGQDDLLFFYSDGVTEARSADMQFFEDRLADELAGVAGRTAGEATRLIQGLVTTFPRMSCATT